MSMLYIRPYFSVVADNNNKCPISIYSRFLIALFVLGIGLSASALIKELSPHEAIPTSVLFEDDSPAVKGSLESVPRDFTLNSSIFDSNRLSARNNALNPEPLRYSVGKKPSEQSACPPMDRTYPGASTMSDNNDKPSLPLNSGKKLSEEEYLKLGYRRHFTSNGDCLKKLAEQYLHDADRWEEIYKLNKDSLTNQNVVPIGIVLIIPPK